jgi:ATP-grasp domain
LKATEKGIGYPRQYDVDVVLRDGSTVRLRPALSADLEPLTRFLSGLSEESKVFRFFHAVKETAHLAASLLDMDYQKRFSLVALHAEPEVGFLVQQMVPNGVEMIVGVVQDPVFGPVVACGAGGTAVQLMKRARHFSSAGRLSRRLEGRLGGAQMPASAGERTCGGPLRGGGARLNPVVATSAGVVTVDARVRIEARDPQRPEGSLFRAVR